jgi:myo-inositol-1(or 4)-monophosphatase
VDKKLLLSQKFQQMTVGLMPEIAKLLQLHGPPISSLKADGSPVTPLDLALSRLIEDFSQKFFPAVTIYSEENFSLWRFPMMAIDPIDGTKEYIKGSSEWAVSVALLETSDFTGAGWVYNPSTKESYLNPPVRPFQIKSRYQGEVSCSEWEKGWYRDLTSSVFSCSPVGSIAYKLGRLAQGQSDFVVSLAPKNIWDVAAGSILCQQAGLKFYSQGKEVKKVQQLYQAPLIWCHQELYLQLCELFPWKDTGL